jgi:transposase
VSRTAAAEPAAQKKTTHDSERDTPRVKQLRMEYGTRSADWSLNRRIYLDETGTHLGLTREYGRAAPGERVVEGTPDYSGPHYTLVAALGWNGIQAPLLFEGPMTGFIFEQYVLACLVPTLCQGDIVIMDNLSAHKRSAIEAAIEARGARLEYLPPYSSDFNPIELGWAKLKTELRTAKARIYADLVEAIRTGLQLITAAEAQAWFAHCHSAINA